MMDLHSIERILADNSEVPDQIIGNGILPYVAFLLITSAAKGRKTMLAFNLVIAIACGISFLCFKIIKPHKVLVLSAEGGYFSNWERIKKMCRIMKPDQNNLLFSFDPRIQLNNDEDYEKLRETINRIKPDVLVIDPFVKFHHLDENSATEMSLVLGRMRNLIEDFKLSIILIHHEGKDSSNGARGSSAILGEYDSCINISRIGGKNSFKHKLEFDLRHAQNPEPVKSFFNQNTFWFESVSPIFNLVKNYGPINKKDLVDLLIVEGFYDSQSGAYKAIDKEIEQKSIFLDTDDLLKIVDRTD